MTIPIAEAYVNAFKAGDLVEVERSINSWKSSLDSKSLHGPSAVADHPLQAGLVAAAENGQADVVRLLLNDGFRVMPDVILAASKSQSPAVFQAMIDSGWNINQSAGLTGDAVSHAAAADRYDLTKWLLEHVADPNFNDRAALWTALDLVAMHASPATAKLLVEYGAHVRNTNCLLIAARYGRVDMTKVLLDYGADVDEIPNNKLISDQKRKEGLVSALDLAKREGQEAAVSFLTERQKKRSSERGRYGHLLGDTGWR